MSKRELFVRAFRAVRDNGGSPWFVLTLKGKRSNSDAWLASDYFPRSVSREEKVEAIRVALEVYHAHPDRLVGKLIGAGVDPAELESVV